MLPRLSVLGNPNTMAGFIALVIPIVLYKGVVARKTITRILLGLWLAMLTGAILLTQSRGGILGAVAAFTFFAAVWFVKNRRYKFTFAALNKWALTLIGLITFAGFGWLIFGLREISGAATIRRQVMTGALKTWQNHPVFGSGLGTLGQELIQNQKPLDAIWADAHNLYLTVCAETGLIGAIGLVWLIGAGLKLLWSTLKHADSAQWDLSGLACAAALTGFALHNLVDSLLKFPMIMMLVAVWAGFWVGTYTNLTGFQTLSGLTDKPPAKFWSRAVTLVALVVLAATFIVGRRGIQNIEAYNQAVEAAVRDDWHTAADNLRQADQLAPDMPFYRRQLGFAAGYLSQQEPDYRAEAINQYRAALEDVNQLSIDHANLACLLWENGQQTEAVKEMTLAHQLEPEILIYRLNLGHYLELTGNFETAWAEYAHILTIRPDYLQADYWHQTERRAAALPKIVEQAASNLSNSPQESFSRLIQLHLVNNNSAAAWQVYNDYLQQLTIDPVIVHLEKGKILLTEGSLDKAGAEFAAALQLDPASEQIYFYLSKVALAKGQTADARRNIDIALNLNQGPEVLYQAGLVAEAIGDKAEAARRYEQAYKAFVPASNPKFARYAIEAARRRPLPKSYLPCLIRIYPMPHGY